MPSASFRLKPPAGFRLRSLVRSHGWVMLSPMEEARNGFRFATRLGGSAAGVTVTQERRGAPLSVRVAMARSPTVAHRRAARRQLARMLHLERDLAPFHAAVRREPGLAWIARRGWGHLLAAPSFFEDAAKMILTTNCTWRQTTAFCQRLVAGWGDPVARGPHATSTFPAPGRIARLRPDALRRAVGCGYRAPYLVELAKRAADGAFDGIEDATRDEAETLIASVKGCGPYATRHLLHLLGHNDRVPWDSWLTRKAREIHFEGRQPTARQLEALYARFGEHQGAVAWFDLNRDFFRDGKTPGSPA